VAGRVELILTAPAAGEPAEPRQIAQAIAGRGIEGDRYLLPTAATGKSAEGNLTLIESASLEHLVSLGLELSAADLRRNILTSGIELNGLVGSEFMVGEVRCLGTELCEPCRYIEKRTTDGVLKALVGRGGIRAEILSSGAISVGDSVTAV